MTLGTALLEIKTEREVVEGQQCNHTNKEQSQLPFALSLLLMLQVNQGLYKWVPYQGLHVGFLVTTFERGEQFIVYIDVDITTIGIDK